MATKSFLYGNPGKLVSQMMPIFLFCVLLCQGVSESITDTHVVDTYYYTCKISSKLVEQLAPCVLVPEKKSCFIFF